jgi:hypothetical protein
MKDGKLTLYFFGATLKNKHALFAWTFTQKKKKSPAQRATSTTNRRTT